MKAIIAAIFSLSFFPGVCAQSKEFPILYDVPKLLSDKQAIISAFGDEGECSEEWFKEGVGLRCFYSIEMIDVFYIDGKPKSFSVHEGGFADFRRLELSSLSLLGITDLTKGVVENENKYGIRWSSKLLNLEVNLFGDGSGQLTHSHITRLNY